jgi:hypothetical protein
VEKLLPSGAVVLAARGVITLGLPKHFSPLLAAGNASLDSWHVCPSSSSSPHKAIHLVSARR